MPVSKISIEELREQLDKTNERLTAEGLDPLEHDQLFALQLELIERIERLRLNRRKFETIRW